MSVSAFAHPWLSGLLGDAEVAALFSAETQLSHMLAFQRALTDALEATGRLAPEDAAVSRAALDGFVPDMGALARGTARDGVVVPALVAQLRAGCPAPEALHAGATSQDVIDTALACTLRDLSAVLAPRLGQLEARLDALEAAHGARPLMARTRMQAARPVTVAHRLASWRRPLADLAARLPAVTADAARLQLGGPVGDRAAFGARADAVAAHMARALGLAEPGHAWHAERRAVVAHGDWLSHLAGHLGRIGQDVALMAQQGIGTVALAGGGASSSMAHKRNPVQAETLQALALFAAAQAGGLHGALLHEQERSGAAWTLEWMLLPPLAAAAGAATRTAADLLGQITQLGDPAQG